MILMRFVRLSIFAFIGLFAIFGGCTRSIAQAALLMEEPYAFFGTLNPTGHTAIYLGRVCAETPVKLRRCEPGESGSVISRYQGIHGYDWVAVPLVPYLYSVEDATDVPAKVDRASVRQMRNRYREANLLSLGRKLSGGNMLRGGWTQLVGVAYERRIYAFRFETTPEQDDALIARMNSSRNRSHFELFYNNCADFARGILDWYFPRTFRRSFFPDAGMTTPKQIAHKLVKYARAHPETQLKVFEISQVPGYRRTSHKNKGIAESLTTTGYAIPLVLVNPYVLGGLGVNYLMRGRYHVIPKDPPIVGPENLFELTPSAPVAENPESAGVQAPSAASSGHAETYVATGANSGLEEIRAANE